MKTCIKCERQLDDEEFHLIRQQGTRRSDCKRCYNFKMRVRMRMSRERKKMQDHARKIVEVIDG